MVGISCSKASYAEEEFTNFRIGVGYVENTVLSDSQVGNNRSKGSSLFAEFPQHEHLGSRFIIYKTYEDDFDSWGFETQLMWGFGLDQPGFRIHTGPAWHREVLTINEGLSEDKHVFNGWGWQAGLGFQFSTVTLEITSTYRDPTDYKRYERKSGGSGEDTKSVLSQFLVSYRF